MARVTHPIRGERVMRISSREADLALAELAARRNLDEASRTGDRRLIREKTVELALAETARREG